MVEYLSTHQADLYRNQVRMQDLASLLINHVAHSRGDITTSQMERVGIYEHNEGRFFASWAIKYLVSRQGSN